MKKYRLIRGRLNSLDFIDKDSSEAPDQIRDVAAALVIRTGDEKEQHWPDSAEAVIGTAIGVVVYYGLPGKRSLQEVAAIISHPRRFDQMVQLAVESEAWGGALSRMGGTLLHLAGDEKSSVLSTTARFLRFLNSPIIAESTQSSNFDLLAIRQRPTTTYWIVPLQHARAAAPLLRLWITSFTHAVIQGQMQEKKKYHFIFDEAALALGGAPLGAVQDLIERLRSWGVRCQFYFQSRGQLARNFKEDGGLTLISNTTKLFFAISDPDTGDFVEKSLGQQTLVIESGGTSRSTSRQHSSDATHSSGSVSQSTSSNQNWQLHGRSLMQSSELMALDRRILIASIPGMRPVMTWMLRWFEEKPEFWKRPSGAGEFVRALRMLMMASIQLTLWTTCAVGVTWMAIEATHRQQQAAQRQQEAIERFQESPQGQHVPAPVQRRGSR